MRLMEKYFDDLSVGDSETTHRRTVTEADVTMWCMFTGDWFPIHCDKVYAEASMFKQRVAPGLMVVAMTGGLVVPAQTRTVIANYGTDRLRYPNPTFIGDTIRVVNTVESLNQRDERSGIANLKWEVFKQDDKLVCTLILRALFATSAADAAAEVQVMAAPTAVDWDLPAAPERIAAMRARLRATRLPASAVSGWQGGIDLDWLSGFASFLADTYDWETDRGRFGERHAMIPFDEAAGEGGLHVALPAGAPEGRTPVLLLHGWPSSGLEYTQVAAQLEQAGLYPIIADLPGFGFSAPTPVPAGPRQIAGILRRAMEQGLGITNFAVHGNDWGATTAGWLVVDHADAISGIHISMMGLRPTFGPEATKPDETEVAWIKTVQRRLAADAGYREIQGTHPNTAAVGLSDSPIGLAAWIAEKLHGWNGGGTEPAVPREDIAALVTAYWISGALPSANWIYRAVREHDETAAPAGGTGDTPVGLSFFENGFFPPPPRSWCERVHNVVNYTTHPEGGHYPAFTAPVVLAGDIRDYIAGLG